jgi:protein-disulfide isomerase
MAESPTPNKPALSWVKALPRDVWYVGGIVLALLIAGVIWSMTSQGKSTGADAGDGGVRIAPGKLPEKPGDMAIGSPDAPIQVVEYASFTCPHCARFMVGREGKPAVFPPLKTKYVDTGKVRWILREFPLNYADMAAYYGLHCAFGTNAQRYFSGAEVVFARQLQWLNVQTEKEAVENLAGIMREFGLGRAQFDACVTSDSAQKQLDAEREEAQKTFKVDSTPTFIINGAKYSGELELPRFEAILAPLLPKKG